MRERNQKFICAGVCFLFFLFIGFFYLSINKVCASLEVAYPVISGQSLNTNTNLTLPSYVLYLFNVGMFLGFFSVFISLTIAGVIYLMSPAKPDLLADAKDRVGGAISGLLILVLTYLIITTINPQLSFLNFNKLPQTPSMACNSSHQCVTGGIGNSCNTNNNCLPPGVYFYNESGCSDNSVHPNTSSIPNLGALKNQINSASIVQDTNTGASYISILYANPNFWGKCQYLDPTKNCQTVTPFASSASIYPYDFNPNGDGVYFYRKSCFNNQAYANTSSLIAYCNANSGGYYKVPNSSISNIYIKKLGDLKFTNVPKEEQDCTGYDKYGNCISRTLQTLSGENISSMIINGNYLVLFVYFGPNDNSSGPWTSCQEFPTPGDVNKLGPRQIKWEGIRNTGGVIPNYVIIIPIQE